METPQKPKDAEQEKMEFRQRTNEDVKKRNLESVFTTVTQEQAKIENLNFRVSNLDREIALIKTRLDQMNQMFASALASLGNGPTEK